MCNFLLFLIPEVFLEPSNFVQPSCLLEHFFSHSKLSCICCKLLRLIAAELHIYSSVLHVCRLWTGQWVGADPPWLTLSITSLACVAYSFRHSSGRARPAGIGKHFSHFCTTGVPVHCRQPRAVGTVCPCPGNGRSLCVALQGAKPHTKMVIPALLIN